MVAVMQRRPDRFNAKRAIIPVEALADLSGQLSELARRVRYGGHPEHKRDAGDFKLTSPAAPRRGKSLCDDAAVFRRQEAVVLLRTAFERGLVDARWAGKQWPKLVWAVSATGVPLEAQREAEGVYHGYPMPEGDPLRDEVMARWTAQR
jgi:hypothetical protein